MWEYGCVQCQQYHRQGDELYEPHLFHQSKHGLRQVPVAKPKILTQATLKAGDRELCVQVDSISVFPANSYIRSNAAWIETDNPTGYPHLVFTPRFPEELKALIAGVLNAECPLQPLMDWVIDNGPANLARETEALQANVLAGARVVPNPEPEEVPF